MAGSPTTPGGSSGGGATRSAGPAPRLTFFKWTEATIGAFTAVTPKEGEVYTGPKNEIEHIQVALGIDKAKAKGDARPTLVYFHWPHDDTPNGKLTTTICTRVLDDEQAARWSKLFRCVQIDMAETKAKYAEMIGAGKGPSFVAINHDLEVKARIDGHKSGAKLRKSLEKAFNAFPAYKKQIRRKMVEHKKMIAKAKRLEKKKEFDEALELIDEIRFGDIRVHSEFEKAFSYGQLLAQKAERHRAKER